MEKEIGRGCQGGYGSGRHGDEAGTVLAETADRLSMFEDGRGVFLLSVRKCWG